MILENNSFLSWVNAGIVNFLNYNLYFDQPPVAEGTVNSWESDLF